MSDVFSDKNLNGNALLQVGKVEITVDAADSNDAVRKSQAESIASNATQSAIVNSLASPNATTTLDTEQLQSQLNAKQNNMSIDPASTSFLEIVDGTKIKLKDLGIIKTYRDTTNTSLTAFIAACTFNGDGTITVGGETLDKMTFIFLTNATLPEDRSFVYLGTNNGDATDFVVFGANYNETEIRSFFSGSGTGITFDANTGVFTLDIGTTASDLGGQTIPHGATFTTISTDGKIKDALVKLEALINAVDQSGADGTAAVTTRLNNLSGVTGNNMGTFTGSVFSDNKNVKQLLQESETAHESATSDRAAIRSEATARANTVDANLASAVATLEAADTAEANTRATADASLQTGINAVSSNLTSEISRAQSAEQTNATAIAQESTDRAAGIAAEQAARTAAVASEAAARTAADDTLQDQINVLASSNIELVGSVGTNGLFEATEPSTDTRNGEVFTSIAMTSGEVVIIDGDVTMLGEDFKVGDTLTVKVAAIVAGNMQLSDFIYQKGSNTDLTRANLDNVTITLDGSEKLIVTHGSIERQELGSLVKSELDDTVSLTDDSQVITGKALQVDQTDNNLGSSYGVYIRKDQTGSETLTGTCRALLVENLVNSQGSTNALIPNYAHNTIASHYDGSCNDLSMVLSGSYNEANVTTATSAIIANGSYSVSNDAQLGINVGATMIAENAAISNISAFAFAGTDGAGADRGVVGAISNLDVATYSGTRQADPYPYNDIAVVADAKYSPAGSKALYAYGDVVLEGGTVTVPTPTVSGSSVNLGYVKGKQDIIEFDLSSGSATVTTSLDLDKVPPVGDGQIKHGVTGVTVSVSENVATSELTFTATGANVSSLTSVKVYLQELSCDVRSV